MKTEYPESTVRTYFPASRIVRRIVCPTDLKRTSRKALGVAITLARQNDAEIFIVHALSPPTPIFETESSCRKQAEAALIKLKERISSRGIQARRVLIKGTARVAVSIARCAQFFGADLIVVGTGGRTGVSRILAGSIVAKLIRISPCPVLVVKSGRNNWSRKWLT
jgi:nucleotide-binding universal stress UspA family protein